MFLLAAAFLLCLEALCMRINIHFGPLCWDDVVTGETSSPRDGIPNLQISSQQTAYVKKDIFAKQKKLKSDITETAKLNNL